MTVITKYLTEYDIHEKAMSNKMTKIINQGFFYIHLNLEGLDIESFLQRMLQCPPSELNWAYKILSSETGSVEVASKFQAAYPLGVGSPRITTPEQAKQVIAYRAEFPLTDWEGEVVVRYTMDQRSTSQWKAMDTPDCDALRDDWLKEHELPVTEDKEDLLQKLLFLLRIHVEIEKLDSRSFLLRVKRLSFSQLQNVIQWIDRNPLFGFDDMALLCPPDLESRKQNKLGLESGLLNTPELKTTALRLAQGTAIPQEYTFESWSLLPQGAKDRLAETIGRIYYPQAKDRLPSAMEKIRTIIIEGFLRIHMDVEKQPVETFLLRIRMISMRKATTAWNKLKRTPATSVQPRISKRGSAKT